MREQSCLALRAVAVKLAPQLLDLKLEMSDQRFRIRVHGLRTSRNRLGFQTPSALRQDHRVSGGEIGRKRFSNVFHEKMESHPP
ncbi:MAG TPA: hypothetical protein VKQ27_15940 [Acetobacteraceae bacterium]|nr:hypothetical protein [Acetobacteraceae bacterium]